MQFRKVIIVVAVCITAVVPAATPRLDVNARHHASLSDDLRVMRSHTIRTHLKSLE